MNNSTGKHISIFRNSDLDATDPKCNPNLPLLVCYLYAKFLVISQSYMKLLTGNHCSMFGSSEPNLDPLTPNLIPTFLSF